ncbi:MAG: polyribonucleotide nucleotidyltransferase [Planctomycetes bacterium]|nr:polyribonucleotide nucleotidyltransferase [Planctomycetota bacterium]
MVKVEKEIAGRVLSLETGKIAKQADGAVVVRYGDTVILATAQSTKPREGIDWFPLFVDYREKFQAAGKIPGGRFHKREGRPTLKETLTMRMIDRPIRPLFPEGYKNEVQIMTMVLSADGENDSDILAMIGAAAALCISSIPFDTPVGVARIGRVDGKMIANPTVKERELGDLDLVVCANGDQVVMMEAGAIEIAEDDMIEAVRMARGLAADVSDLITQLKETCAKPKQEVPSTAASESLVGFIRTGFEAKIEAALSVIEKQERRTAMNAVREEIAEKALEAGLVDEDSDTSAAFEEVMRIVVRKRILEGRRTDGRTAEDIRPISCEVAVLPRTHGSALFTRGETQVLATVTLGTSRDEEMVESLVEDYTRKFILHYNFPPFSVGEVKPVRGPSRRDIGHGALAEKALASIIPDQEEFPYTIRIVSDVMESNGSSSMATVCGATLSLMDAGVTIAQPVAGISIGMVEEDGNHLLLTDIQGEEDHYGDMDFKVAGTQNGICAVQVDIKIAGLSDEVIVGAFTQAREARMQILRKMLAVISKPRDKISVYAPKLVKIKINPDKIGRVIGSGGKVVRKLQEDTGTTIELDDDGTVTISAQDAEAIEAAKEIVLGIVAEPEIGKTYTGTVRGIKDFGAFVEILPGQEGLVHISELDDGYVGKVTDIVRMGDEVTVKCIGLDQGKIRLSRKAAMKDANEAAAS